MPEAVVQDSGRAIVSVIGEKDVFFSKERADMAGLMLDYRMFCKIFERRGIENGMLDGALYSPMQVKVGQLGCQTKTGFKSILVMHLPWAGLLRNSISAAAP